MALFVILLCVSCKAPILRQTITGVIVDSNTDAPLPQATIYSYDGTTELAQSDGKGKFLIAPVRDTHILFPGEEKGALSPNSDKICIKKSGYENDTIFIYDSLYYTTSDTIQLDKIALHPIMQDQP